MNQFLVGSGIGVLQRRVGITSQFNGDKIATAIESRDFKIFCNFFRSVEKSSVGNRPFKVSEPRDQNFEEFVNCRPV